MGEDEVGGLLGPGTGAQSEAGSLSHASGPARRRLAVHLALLAIAVSLVFANSIGNGLYVDDAARVQNNPGVNQFWPPWRHFLDYRTNSGVERIAEYRPMLPLSLSVDVAVSDATSIARSRIHHLGNILVHLVNCVLLYLLFRQLLLYWSAIEGTSERLSDLAFAASLLFAIHPVSGVPINYVSARDLQLMFCFLLASLVVYVWMRRRGESPLRWVASLTLLALALLSKQNAAVMPALVFGFDFLVGGGRLRSWRTWFRPLPFAAVVAGFLFWSRFVVDRAQLAPGSVEGALAYSATQFKLHVFYYLRNAFWPFRMRLLPDVAPSESFFEPAVVVGLFFLLGSVILVFALRRRAPVTSWSIAAYWILFAPSSLFAFRRMTYFAIDYRQYAPLAFLCLVLVLSLTLVPRRALTTGITAAMALYFGISAFQINRIWRTDESVYGHAVRLGARSVAEMNYAMAVEAKNPALAKKHYLEALRKKPQSPYPLINLGLLYLRSGKAAEGLLLIQFGVDHRPDWGATHYWLAYAYRTVGRLDDARRESLIAADLDPRNAQYQYQAGADLQQAGDFAGSLEYLERVTRFDSGHRDALFLVALALQKTGRWPAAEKKYEQFLRRKPGHHQAWYNLGYGLMASARCDDAIDAFTEVLRLDRGLQRVTHRGLATCYESLGKRELQEHHARLAQAPQGT